MRIIGVDPGSRITGYGIVDCANGVKSAHVAHGHIVAVKGSFADRLATIHEGLENVVAQWQPDQAALEDAFVGINPSSALKLGQARGAAIIALKSVDLAISNYAPRTVKQAVTGDGGADKKAIQKMVVAMLNIEHGVQADAADGLAIALCHAHSYNSSALARPSPRRRRKGRGRGLRLSTVPQ